MSLMEKRGVCGCDPSVKVAARTSIEEKLETGRRTVTFCDRKADDEFLSSGEQTERREHRCKCGYENLSDEPDMVVTPVDQRSPNDHFTIGVKVICDSASSKS
ncbi:hypothetical protein EGW08_013594, partial [Elysia chlorotica]